MSSKNRVVVASLCCFALMSLVAIPTAGAHTSATVNTCEPNTSCTSAVFAVCDPVVAVTTGACSSRRTVDVVGSGWPASTNVHVWFLKGEVDNPTTADCLQAVTAGSTRTHISDATSSSGGAFTIEDVVLPPGNLAPNPLSGQGWVYGPNWVCATTDGHSGGGTNNAIGDRLFTIYPV